MPYQSQDTDLVDGKKNNISANKVKKMKSKARMTRKMKINAFFDDLERISKLLDDNQDQEDNVIALEDDQDPEDTTVAAAMAALKNEPKLKPYSVPRVHAKQADPLHMVRTTRKEEARVRRLVARARYLQGEKAATKELHIAKFIVIQQWFFLFCWDEVKYYPAQELAQTEVQRRPIDTCSICLEKLEDNIEIEKTTTWCAGQCGHSFHKNCQQYWIKMQTDRITKDVEYWEKGCYDKHVSCSYCRSRWQPGTTRGQQVIGLMIAERWSRFSAARSTESICKDSEKHRQGFQAVTAVAKPDPDRIDSPYLRILIFRYYWRFACQL